MVDFHRPKSNATATNIISICFDAVAGGGGGNLLLLNALLLGTFEPTTSMHSIEFIGLRRKVEIVANDGFVFCPKSGGFTRWVLVRQMVCTGKECECITLHESACY